MVKEGAIDTGNAPGVDSAYKIILSDDPDELATHVEQAMSQGWVPLGGIAIAFDTRQPLKDGKIACAQAMVHQRPQSTED